VKARKSSARISPLSRQDTRVYCESMFVPYILSAIRLYEGVEQGILMRDQTV
jgi:hypothetical protein